MRDGSARLFSRRLNDVTESYPEIRDALASIPADAILDGEIVAMRDGRVLPFRFLQARLQRKVLDDSLLREVPIAYVVFDVLALGDELLLDEPLAVRRERLADLFEPSALLVLAPFMTEDESARSRRQRAFRGGARARQRRA